ncbi:MAG: glycosyl hydrolase family 28 protein [bacterium]
MRITRENTLSLSESRFTFLRSSRIGFLLFLAVGLSLGFCVDSAGAPLGQGGMFDVTEYGALGNGEVKDTRAIQKAIDVCSAFGGGTVYFPAGTYLSGSIHLKDNVTLNLTAGASICASTDQADFDPYETLDFENDSDGETTYFHYSLIWGEDVSNVAIIGQGTVDGNRNKRHGPKPIAIKRGRYIAVRDITIVNAPNYCISLLGCDYVDIDGVTILNAYCDGIDPDCCRHVRISNCHIESWDDAIVLKSSFSLGEVRATENVTVTNCILSTSCNAFKMGTESRGGFKYVTVSNCVMYGPPDRKHSTSGVALETVDGAVVDGIVVTNISMLDVDTPIFIRLGNRGRDMETPVPGTLRNVTISNIEATGAVVACSIAGIPGHPVEGVTLSNIRVQYKGGGAAELIDAVVPEQEAKYPEAKMFGNLPASGLYCRHANNITLRDFQTRCVEPDPRPVLICDDVDGLFVSGLTGENTGLFPFIRLQDVRNALWGSSLAPRGTKTFMQIRGEKTSKIRVIGNDLIEADTAFDIGKGVSKKVLFETANNLKGK